MMRGDDYSPSKVARHEPGDGKSETAPRELQNVDQDLDAVVVDESTKVTGDSERMSRDTATATATAAAPSSFSSTAADGIVENTNLDSDEEDAYHQAASGTSLEDALQVDQLRNGLATAASMFSWGLSAASEQAKQVLEKAKKNETVASAGSTLGELIEKAKPGLSEVSNRASAAYEQVAKPGIEKFAHGATEALGAAREATQPTLSEIQAKASAAYDQYAKPSITKVVQAAADIMDGMNVPNVGQMSQAQPKQHPPSSSSAYNGDDEENDTLI